MQVLYTAIAILAILGLIRAFFWPIRVHMTTSPDKTPLKPSERARRSSWQQQELEKLKDEKVFGKPE